MNLLSKITCLCCFIFIAQLLVSQSVETVEAYNKGVASAKEKDHKTAIQHYSTAIGIDPLYAQSYYSRGISKLQLKDLKAAAVDFKKCLKLDPENAKAHYYAAYCLMNMERNEEAIKSFSRALQYDPSLTKVYYYRAKIQMQDENYERAIADFQDAIAKDGADEKVYYQLGVCYLKTGEPKLARQSFGLAIKEDNAYKPAITEKMKLEYKSTGYDESIMLADQLLELEATNEKALYYRAMSLLKSDKLEEAYAAFDVFVTAYPENKIALKNKANISLRQKDYTASIADHTALIAQDTDFKNYYNRALSYMQLEQWNEALADLSQVIKQEPEYAEAFYNRSNVQLQLEKTDEACADMRIAGKLGYENAISYIVTLCGG